MCTTPSSHRFFIVAQQFMNCHWIKLQHVLYSIGITYDIWIPVQGEHALSGSRPSLVTRRSHTYAARVGEAFVNYRFVDRVIRLLVPVLHFQVAQSTTIQPRSRCWVAATFTFLWGLARALLAITIHNSVCSFVEFLVYFAQEPQLRAKSQSLGQRKGVESLLFWKLLD